MSANESPMTGAAAAPVSPVGVNTRVLDRIQCPRCLRLGVPVMLNFKLYGHGQCLGAPAELVFTAMLRLSGLDRRPDRMQSEFADGIDYDAVAERGAER